MQTDDSHKPHQEHVVLGMLAAMGAFFCFSLMFMFSKLLSVNHSVIEIGFYRNVIAIVPFLVMIFAFGRRDILVIKAKPGLIALRAVLGVVGLFVTFAAFALMPMADTTALLFTSSLFIPLLGVVFLRESVGPYRWSAVVAGFVGVLIMANPTGGLWTLGIFVALGAAMVHATLQIILRYLGPYEKPETISFYFFAIGIVVAALPMPWVATVPTAADVPLLLGVGLSGTGAQWLLSIAYRHAQAAIVTVFNYSQIVWSTAFGWMIWNDWPLPNVVLGAAIVVASNILMIWRESRLGRVTEARDQAKL